MYFILWALVISIWSQYWKCRWNTGSRLASPIVNQECNDIRTHCKVTIILLIVLIVILPLVFRKLLYSDLFDFLLTSVLTFTFPCNFFLWNYHILIWTLQYQYPITDLSFSYFLVSSHSLPNKSTYVASTTCIPCSDLNILMWQIGKFRFSGELVSFRKLDQLDLYIYCSKFFGSTYEYHMSDGTSGHRVCPWILREWNATLTGSIWPI